MAGAGSRFAQAGYTKPKPFIDVNGKPMIVRVLENLVYPGAHYILIARKEHLDAEAPLVSQIEKDFDRDNWMTAAEAKQYGLIDEVLLTNPKKQNKS